MRGDGVASRSLAPAQKAPKTNLLCWAALEAVVKALIEARGGNEREASMGK